MARRWLAFGVALGSVLAAVAAWAESAAPTLASALERGAVRPVEAAADVDPARRALGERLFHDPILSRDRDVSCATCHDLANYGTDGRRRSVGTDGREGPWNAPSVLNGPLNFRQFWDGRAATLEEQIDGPLLSSHEMASSWPQVRERLASDAGYVAAFRQAYRAPPSEQTIKDALATFQRSLVQTTAPFDRWLRGDARAIPRDAVAGFALFESLGCVSCHQGEGLGGNMFQRFGLFGPPLDGKTPLTPADLGRFNVTGREEDRYVFKVPSLRQVAATAPYFHDGTVATLDAAVRVMARAQLGRRLQSGEVARLVAFLETLTAPSPTPRHAAK